MNSFGYLINNTALMETYVDSFNTDCFWSIIRCTRSLTACLARAWRVHLASLNL